MASETASSECGAAFRTSVFTLAKSCSIGLRSGEYLGRKRRRAPAALTRCAHRLSLVRAEIVEHDDVVALERREQELLDVGEEALAIDGSVEQTRRFDPIAPQSGAGTSRFSNVREEPCRRVVRPFGAQP